MTQDRTETAPHAAAAMDRLNLPNQDELMPVAAPCTCHPDDNPPQPCAQRYALGDCRAAALGAEWMRREADPSAPIDLSQEAVDDMAWTLDHMGEPGSRPRHAAAMLRALRAAAPADPVAEAALHRSFPDVGDGRPMPPMGDELMICGLNEADARFVAVQLANHGLTLRNWRKTAINAMDLAHSDYMTGKGRDPAKYTSQFSMAATALRAIGEASHAAD